MAQYEELTVNVLVPQPYTVATVPPAAQNSGQVIFVSNGSAGNPCLAYSNGTNWVVLPGATAISAT